MPFISVKILNKPNVKSKDLLGVYERALSVAMYRLAAAFEHAWKNRANNQLHESYGRYHAGLSVDVSRKGKTHVFALAKGLPTMVEFGVSKYDMKPSFLNNPNAHISAKGNRYLKIPFRFYKSKPKQQAYRGLQYHAEAVKGFRMLKALQNPATTEKELKKQERAAKRYREWNARQKAAKGFSHTGYEHKVGKVANLMHSKQFGLNTIRTVSEASAASSWFHPGIRARLIHKAVFKKLPALVKAEVDPIMAPLGVRSV